MLTNLIPVIKYCRYSILKMVASLLPRGPIWRTIIHNQSPTWVTENTYFEHNFDTLLVSNLFTASFIDAYSIISDFIGDFYSPYTDSNTEKEILSSTLSGNSKLDFNIRLSIDIGHIVIVIKENDTTLFSIGFIAGDNSVQLFDATDTLVEEHDIVFHTDYKLLITIKKIDSSYICKFNYSGITTVFTNTILSSYLDFTIYSNATVYNFGYEYFRFQSQSGLPEINENANSNLIKLLSCFADAYYDFELKINELIRETIPGLSKNLLIEWEKTANIPEYIITNGTLQQRRDYVHTKITQNKGNLSNILPMTSAYFIAYAASFGIAITIDSGEYGNIFRWSNKAKGDIQRLSSDPITGINGCRFNTASSAFVWVINIISDPYNSQTLMETIFEEIKPAHIQFIYN